MEPTLGSAAVMASSTTVEHPNIKKDMGAPEDTESDGVAKTPDGKAPRERRRATFQPTYQFWAIMVALCVTSWLAALENTVIVTTLPTIAAELGIGADYVWIGNVFFLTR